MLALGIPHTYLFAQDGEGSRMAGEMINQSLSLQAAIQDSWDDIWLSIADSSSSTTLWSAVISGAQILAIAILVYMFVKYASEFQNIRSLAPVVEWITWPLIVAILLGGNGAMLAQTVLALRSLFETALAQVQQVQLVGIRIGLAARQLQLNNLGVARMRQLLNECSGAVGDQLEECFLSKSVEANALIEAVAFIDEDVDTSALEAFGEAAFNLTGFAFIRDAASFYQRGFLGIVQDRLFPIVQVLLFSVQWAFVQLVETALVLTAALAPVALVLSLLPVSGRPIFAWGSGFLALYGIKFGYVITVGVLSAVLVNTTGGIAEVSTEYGFLVFVSFFAPVIAVGLSSFGGIAIFNGISRRSAQIVSAVTGGISTAVTRSVR